MELDFLGYQLRVDVVSIEASDADERSRFLLSPNTSIQLSADSSVWPKLRWSSLDAGKSGHDRTKVVDQLNGLGLISASLAAEYIKSLGREACACLIKLEVSNVDASRIRSLNAITPEQDNYIGNMDWEVAGFDVCDDFMRSAIANIGIGAKWASVRKDYGGRTNSWGLFSDIEDALAYAEEFSKIVSEHAPFSPWRISLCRLRQ